MNDPVWVVVGSVAAALTAFSFIPQIIKVARTRSAKDVSVATLVQLAAGVTLWILYGIHLRDVIIIAANGITLASMAVLLFLYRKYAHR